MEAYRDYWAATMLRGLLAVLAGTAVLFISAMAETVVLLPVAFVVAILTLAAYVTLDSALVVTTSFMIPRDRPGRFALRAQGLCGAAIGVLLFSLVYEHLDPRWFLYLLAVQAASAAATEFVVARGTAEHHGAVWCYASSAIAAVSTLVLLLGRNLGPRGYGWLIFGYLGVFGFNLLALSARMLFAVRHQTEVQVVPRGPRRGKLR